MTRGLIVAAVVAFVLGWNYIVYRRSGRPLWNPLWTAFTLTAIALFYGVAGLLGYEVPRHNPIIDHPIVHVGHVVWPQVGVASATLVGSILLWRIGLKRSGR